MIQKRHSSKWNVIAAYSATFFFATVLLVVRPPQAIIDYWPDWVALILIYWATSEPERIGPSIGFLSGILLEVVLVKTFGVYALGLTLIAFFANRIHQQFRVLGVWQKVLLVGIFVLLYKALVGWLNGLLTDFTLSSSYFYPVLGSMLLWPFMAIVLREVRRISRVY